MRACRASPSRSPAPSATPSSSLAWSPAQVVLSVLRSGDALEATLFIAPAEDDAAAALGAVHARGVVDVTGGFGLVPDRWLARPPGMAAAPALSGRAFLGGDLVAAVRVADDEDHEVAGCAPLRLARASSAAGVDRALPLGASTWQGRYTCLQGETKLMLDVTHDAPDDLAAVFRFAPGPETPDIPSGSFHLSGAVDRVHGRVVLAPGDWIEHPRAG